MIYAWLENEDERLDNVNNPEENRRLLTSGPFVKHNTCTQSDLTFGMHPDDKNVKNPQINKRKEKLVTLLKPPYFIVSVVFIIILVHKRSTEHLRKALEWSPVSWWMEPWRLLTYGFIHTSDSHLARNTIVAIIFGWVLEREQSWWRTLCLWCGGLVAGALGTGLLQPNVNVLGASAAVYALLTAHISNVCLRYDHIPLWWFRPLSVLMQGISEICWVVMRPSPPSGHTAAQVHASSENVAWAAHVLGAAVGIPLAFVVFTGENYNKPFIVACRVISALLLIAGFVLATVCYTR